MEEEKKKQRQKIAVFYDSGYKEISRIRYTKVQIGWLTIFVFIVLFVADFFIVSYSPLKYFIPDYPTKEIITTMRVNDVMLDSIQQQLKTKNQYISNLIKILKGDSLDNYNPEIIGDSNPKFPQIENVLSPEDSSLRQEVEEQEMFSTQLGNTGINAQTNLYQLNFFPPVKGVVSNPFNPSQNHLGTDIVASPNQLVLAALDGTIINASWAAATGYSVQVQHKSNIITAYKHLTDVIVREGDKVVSGQPIATVGNTGELSTGPHLHFELWQNGTPLNAEEYISFK
ncbi:MAG: M23 family metallopeptidase [Bacteroidales bacterium]|nr:M23 family metallopeptidase [Bacteroidales bacterium]